jgi:hypothetical protein
MEGALAMITITLPIAVLVLALLGSGSLAVAQDKMPPPSPAQVDAVQKEPSVPPIGTSAPDQGGKQEPSAKIAGTNPHPEPLWNGALTVAGAPADVDTVPSLYSPRTAAADKLPIAAYALRHLTDAQRGALRTQLAGVKPEPPADASAAYAIVGAELPPQVALEHLEPLPRDIVSRMPEMRGVAFTAVAGKLLLVDADNRMVIAVL